MNQNRACIPLIPALLLAGVAFHQIYLAHTAQLSPWKGGGFGMFSSAEIGGLRTVRVFVTAPERSEELQIPESLADAALRAATLPTDRLLQKLARGFILRERKKDRPVSTIRFEVWRTEFDRVSLAPTSQKIRDYVYSAD